MTVPAPEQRRFRRVLLRVLAVQIVTLLLLWWLQAAFTP